MCMGQCSGQGEEGRLRVSHEVSRVASSGSLEDQ